MTKKFMIKHGSKTLFKDADSEKVEKMYNKMIEEKPELGGKIFIWETYGKRNKTTSRETHHKI